MTLVKRWCVLLLITLSQPLCAQQFGGTPSRIRWKQIANDTARIIYPAGQDSLAQRVAVLVHDQQRSFASALGNKVHRVNIVLRNEMTYFNGYVQLGPFRSEYYLTPPQNAFELGAQPVTDLLSIHEYRHVEQYNNFRKGVSKVAYVIFGQNGQALANDAAVPNWFFEGDAVYNETLLSEQGRGRLPLFLNGYKALYLEGKHYHFMKLRNGSFKNYVPNHYPLGYMLVAYGREKYGNDIWKKVTDDAVRFKPFLYPWQGSVKAATGVPYHQFVKDAFSFYEEQWKQQQTAGAAWITETEINNVVDYRYPYRSKQGYVVLKESYNKLPHFYYIDSAGKEERIALQSITNDSYFSYNNGNIVYAAYKPNARWSYREYTSINVVDVDTKREKIIKTGSRYFSPDISHNGKQIAAVRVNESLQSFVDVLNINGNKLVSLTGNNGEIYSYPKFSANDKDLFLIVRKGDGKMSLQQWNISSQQPTVLLPFANRILGFPAVQGDTLLFSVSDNGQDEIWSYIVSQKKAFRMADYQTGLYGAAANDGSIVASAFTSSGYRLGKFKPQWQPVHLEADTITGLYVKKPFANSANEFLQTTPQTDHYPVKRYSKLSHPFNFHSLQPDYSNPVFSLTLYGENVLSTIENQVYYRYNRNEGYNQVGYNITYGVTYLQPFADVSETFGRNVINRGGDRFTYNEFAGIGGVQLPLNLSGGKQYRYLNLIAAYGLDHTQFTGASKQMADNFANGYFQTQVSYTGQRQAALQHIYPHWAQSVSAIYRRLTSAHSADQFLLRGSLYLPGAAPSHSIVLSGAYEAQTRQSSNHAFNFSFSDLFPYSRGYSSYNFPTMYKAGFNYHLPLWYPDFGVANIVYIRRVRANLFFDYTNLKGTVNNQYYNVDLKSTGAEMYFDTKWWNQQSITVGFRYSRLLDYKVTGNQPNNWTLILPSSIFN